MRWLSLFFSPFGNRPTKTDRQGNRPRQFEALERRTLLSVAPSARSALASTLAEASSPTLEPAVSSASDAGPTVTPLAASAPIQTTWSSVGTPSLGISQNTGEKPQSKLWEHDGHWFAALPNSTGTWVWRLDATAWTPVLQLSTDTKVTADIKEAGNVTHVLLYRGGTTQLASIEYDAGTQTYRPWSVRSQNVSINLPSSETATIDIDSQGRMWVAYDNESAGTIEVRYADGPYSNWSAGIAVVSGVTGDDIGALIAMPTGQIGVVWSNQNTKRFGFRTHNDGADPNTWNAAEVPAAQSALNTGHGMADDHMHLGVTADGTVYVAMKTSYDDTSKTEIGLMVRRPNGSWDPLYSVSNRGTRPVVVINEAAGRLLVAYTTIDGGGDILYRESPLDSISFGSVGVLISGGSLNNVTTAKANFTDDIVFLASSGSSAKGTRLFNPQGTPQQGNQAPVVNAGADRAGQTGAAVSLAGSVSDDGQPTNNLSIGWSVVSGPGTVSFANAGAASTSSTFSAAGTYVLRLTASDGELTTTDDVSVFVSNPPGPTPTPASGVTGFWSFNQPSANDSSGNGNNGALFGGASFNGGRTGGGGLMLGNNNQRMVVSDANSLDFGQAITMAAWIAPSQKATQYVLKKATQDSVDGYEIGLSSGGKLFVRFNQRSAGDTLRVESTSSYPTNGTWMHVAATYDGTTIRLYINGQLQGSKAAAFTIGANSTPLGIGAEESGYRTMRGGMDDVLLANRALSANEVSSLYQGTFNTNPTTPTNQGPTVNAGADQSVQLPGTAALSGIANDDGQPSPAALSTTWSLVSGPGSVTFGNANVLSTTATFGASGTYVLRLTANDGQLSASDDLTIAVQSAPSTPTVTVDAGANQSITLPGGASLSATAFQNGQPGLPNGATVKWSLVSGPAAVSFANSAALATTASFNAAGSYVLRVSVATSGGVTSDDLTVAVAAAPTPTPSNGVAGFWDFNARSASDGSGNGNDGALFGGASFNGGRAGGGGLLLNGANQRMVVSDSNSLDFGQSITMAAWIAPSQKATQYVIKKATQDSVDGYEIGLSSGGKVFVRFNQRSAGDTLRVESTSSYPTNGTWMHVAATYDGTTIRLYINGQLQGSKAAAFTIATNSTPLGIGAEESGFRNMRGGIDDVLLAGRALSAGEISSLYQGTFQVVAQSASAQNATSLTAEPQAMWLGFPAPQASPLVTEMSSTEAPSADPMSAPAIDRAFATSAAVEHPADSAANGAQAINLSLSQWTSSALARFASRAR